MQALRERSSGNIARPSHGVGVASKEAALAQLPLQGYLMKLKSKSSITGSWVKRWFVLDPTRKQLLYFSNQKKSTADGAVPSGGLNFSDIDAVRSFDKLRFQIESSVRTFLLRASDEATKERWLARLSLVVAKTSTGSENRPSDSETKEATTVTPEETKQAPLETTPEESPEEGEGEGEGDGEGEGEGKEQSNDEGKAVELEEECGLKSSLPPVTTSGLPHVDLKDDITPSSTTSTEYDSACSSSPVSAVGESNEADLGTGATVEAAAEVDPKLAVEEEKAAVDDEGDDDDDDDSDDSDDEEIDYAALAAGKFQFNASKKEKSKAETKQPEQEESKKAVEKPKAGKRVLPPPSGAPKGASRSRALVGVVRGGADGQYGKASGAMVGRQAVQSMLASMASTPDSSLTPVTGSVPTASPSTTTKAFAPYPSLRSPGGVPRSPLAAKLEEEPVVEQVAMMETSTEAIVSIARPDAGAQEEFKIEELGDEGPDDENEEDDDSRHPFDEDSDEEDQPTGTTGAGTIGAGVQADEDWLEDDWDAEEEA